MLRNITKLLAFAILAPLSGHSSANQYSNVVIGEGCASTCINGVCERTCNGQSDTQKTQTVELDQREYTLKGFDRIITNGVNLTVTHADLFSISAQGDKRCLDRLNVELGSGLNGTKSLKIAWREPCASSIEAKVSVSMPILASLRVYGNADSTLLGFNQPKVNIETYGNANLEVNQNRFSKVELIADDNSTLNAIKSEIFNADVAVRGQSDVTLRFGQGENGYLSGVVAGMSDLSYCGSASKSIKIIELADANEFDCDLN